MTRIKFKYANNRGEATERTVDIDSLSFYAAPGGGQQPGWYISGFDHTRNSQRSFALSRILLDGLPNQGNFIYRLFTLGAE